MNFDKYLLNNIFIFSYPILITLLNFFKVNVNCVGSLHITPEHEIHNVFYVTTFKNNILLTSHLCGQFYCDLPFSKYSCTIQTPFLKKNLVFGDVAARRLCDEE